MTLRDEVLQGNENIVDSFDPELLRAFDVADNEVPAELKKPENVRLNPDKFRLSGDGVFYTIQGEGKTMGLPAVFVRLHLCNLRCVWCDAYYTWNPKSEAFWTESYELTMEELIAEIEKVWPHKDRSPRVIFTGGEPLLQQKLIEKLMYEKPQWRYEVETNGTIMPTCHIGMKAQFNCSPKLANSMNAERTRIKGEVLKWLNEYTDVQFKFVVMTEEDVAEMERDFVVPFSLNPEKIVLMPQGVTAPEVWKNAKNVVEIAKAKGYRLLGRLHVDIWGARRRV